MNIVTNGACSVVFVVVVGSLLADYNSPHRAVRSAPQLVDCSLQFSLPRTMRRAVVCYVTSVLELRVVLRKYVKFLNKNLYRTAG